ncbi:MAG: hypothetical protein U1E36_07375 [Rickettsiales bacterium]
MPREVHRSLDGMTVYLLVLLQENPEIERYQTALIALDAPKASDFIQRYGGKPVNLNEEAIVLWQGDGDYPSADVRQWMKERFGVRL